MHAIYQKNMKLFLLYYVIYIRNRRSVVFFLKGVGQIKKCLFILYFVSVFMVACSNDTDNSNSSSDQDMGNTEEAVERESSDFSKKTSDEQDKQEVEDVESDQSDGAIAKGDISKSDRKIIYTANLRIEVKDYQQTESEMQKQVADRDGYVVSSNRNEDTENAATTGQLTVRIPQASFREFVQLVEDGSSKVLESSVSGEDVTEEYVDLKSRLKSKEVVEERLLSFMEKAERTEDLLSISDDLATVQESIEEITGQMKYLENKTDLATVTIEIQEHNVTISGMNDKDLNTWEKTKQQFMNSINFLISVLSSLFVFIAGSLPVIILFAIIVWIVFMVMRKRIKKE